MAEENQETKGQNQETTRGPKEVTTGPKEVTTKNAKRVEAGRRLAEYNHKKREDLKAQTQKSEVSKYYGIGALLAGG